MAEMKDNIADLTEEKTQEIIKNASESIVLPAKWQFFTDRHGRFIQLVDKNLPKGTALRSAFERFGNISPTIFLQFIGTTIMHSSDNIPKYIDTLLASYDEDRSKYDREVLEKMERYLKFFCEFIRTG